MNSLSEDAIATYASKIVDTWSMETLIDTCIDGQIDYLSSLTDDEVKEYLEALGINL